MVPPCSSIQHLLIWWDNNLSQTAEPELYDHLPKLTNKIIESRHLIGCDKKSEIVRYFQGRFHAIR